MASPCHVQRVVVSMEKRSWEFGIDRAATRADGFRLGASAPTRHRDIARYDIDILTAESSRCCDVPALLLELTDHSGAVTDTITEHAMLLELAHRSGAEP